MLDTHHTSYSRADTTYMRNDKKMNGIISLVLINLLLIISCQKPDKEILNETISAIENIKTVRYNSKSEVRVKGKLLFSSTENLFFDFTNNDNTNGLKYHIQNKHFDVIFNGNETIKSDNEKKIILIDKNTNVHNHLTATLYSLKEILPKLINDDDILIIRNPDSLILNQKHYVFNFIIKKGYIDWMDLSVKKQIDVDEKFSLYDTQFSLIIDKSNFIPKIITTQNQPDGTVSNTLENIDFEYKPEKGIWKGLNLPLDYARHDKVEYYDSLMSNKLITFVGKKIDDWELPNLKDTNLINPSKLKGNVILLEFWFENCGWCVRAIPDLNDIYSKFSDKSFKMYGIEIIKENDRENLINYVTEKKMKYPSLYNGKSIATEYGINYAPAFLIIDKSGTIIYAKSSFNKDDIINLIEENI